MTGLLRETGVGLIFALAFFIHAVGVASAGQIPEHVFRVSFRVVKEPITEFCLVSISKCVEVIDLPGEFRKDFSIFNIRNIIFIDPEIEWERQFGFRTERLSLNEISIAKFMWEPVFFLYPKLVFISRVSTPFQIYGRCSPTVVKTDLNSDGMFESRHFQTSHADESTLTGTQSVVGFFERCPLLFKGAPLQKANHQQAQREYGQQDLRDSIGVGDDRIKVLSYSLFSLGISLGILAVVCVAVQHWLWLPAYICAVVLVGVSCWLGPTDRRSEDVGIKPIIVAELELRNIERITVIVHLMAGAKLQPN